MRDAITAALQTTREREPSIITLMRQDLLRGKNMPASDRHVLAYIDALTAERDALLANKELMQERIATYEKTLVQDANSINWMTHTEDADDSIRRVWVGSDDGRYYAREALEDSTSM